MDDLKQEFQEMAAGERRIDQGVANLARGISADLASTLNSVFFGNGQANPPPYLVERSNNSMEGGLTDIAEGMKAVFGEIKPEQKPSVEVEQPEIKQSGMHM